MFRCSTFKCVQICSRSILIGPLWRYYGPVWSANLTKGIQAEENNRTGYRGCIFLKLHSELKNTHASFVITRKLIKFYIESWSFLIIVGVLYIELNSKVYKFWTHFMIFSSLWKRKQPPPDQEVVGLCLAVILIPNMPGGFQSSACKIQKCRPKSVHQKLSVF